MNIIEKGGLIFLTKRNKMIFLQEDRTMRRGRMISMGRRLVNDAHLSLEADTKMSSLIKACRTA